MLQRLFVTPDASGPVMLTFSTPMLELCAEKTLLFDAIADSFHWVW